MITMHEIKLNISPPLISLHFDDSQLLAKLHKPDTPKRLSQDVC